MAHATLGLTKPKPIEAPKVVYLSRSLTVCGFYSLILVVSYYCFCGLTLVRSALFVVFVCGVVLFYGFVGFIGQRCDFDLWGLCFLLWWIDLFVEVLVYYWLCDWIIDLTRSC